MAAQNMSYFRLAFSSTIVSLTQPQCWCGFWKFRKLYLELLMFSCNIPGHYFYWSPKEIAVSWLLLKPLLFAVETWAYFSTSFFLRCVLMDNTFFSLETVTLTAPSLGEWRSASVITHFHSNLVPSFLVNWTSYFLMFSSLEQRFSILFLKILILPILWKKRKRMMW